MVVLSDLEKGYLCVISGIDGSGKSALLRSMMARCEDLGVSPVKRKFRSGFIKSIYLFLKPGSKRDKIHESGGAKKKNPAVPKNIAVQRIYLFITLLDICLYVVRLRWDLMLQRVIFIDRYYWDSQVEFEEKLPRANITGSFLWRLATRLAPVPDAAFLLHLSTEEAIRRMQVRNTQLIEPFDIQSFEVLEERNLRYQELSRDVRWIVLDATESPERLLEKAWGIVKNTGHIH